ncbi:MAG: YdbH domain-containing protein [Verrucomicrobia bacterium]|nr:YdbH domain-containing protein [Verrucomicrobiota bacterium]
MPEADGTQMNFAVEGAGTQARGTLQFSTLEAGRWTLSEGQLDLAAWLPAVQKRFPALAGLAAQGTITLTGEGDWTGANPRGRLRLSLSDGRITQAAQDIEAEGVELSVEVNGFSPVTTAEAQVLKVRTVRVAGVVLSDLRAVFSLNAAGEISVSEATVALLDGRVSVAPFVVNLIAPKVATVVRIERLSLQELAPYLPHAVASVQGRVSGSLSLTWAEPAGLTPGRGALKLDLAEPASVRLAPSPGFITSRVPERIEFLPEKLGPLRHWITGNNPALATLRAIELGRTLLLVDSLAVDFDPEAVERTAAVHVTARPPVSDVVKEVKFDINVNGPLTDVIGLGLKKKLSVSAH